MTSSSCLFHFRDLVERKMPALHGVDGSGRIEKKKKCGIHSFIGF